MPASGDCLEGVVGMRSRHLEGGVGRENFSLSQGEFGEPLAVMAARVTDPGCPAARARVGIVLAP